MLLNAKQVANIPSRLKLPVDCHIRGEVVMPLKTFEEKYREVSPTPEIYVRALYDKNTVMEKQMLPDLVFCAYDVKL